MGVSLVAAGATVTNKVDFLFPFAANLVGYWLFGGNAAQSAINLKTGLTQGSFLNSPTFSANGFTADGAAAKYFDSGLTQAGAYTFAAVAALPTTSARIVGMYDAGTATIGTHAVNSGSTSITHSVANATRGTLARSASANSLTGQRATFASFDGANALLAVYENGRPLAPAAFPTVSTPPATFTFKAGGGNPATFTGGGVINAAMLYNRALAAWEFDVVYTWLAARMTARGVTLG